MTEHESSAGGAFRPVGVSDLIGKTRDMLTVERVFGAPIEQDGTLLIPVAAVRGMGGGGGGGGENVRGEQGVGEGVGYGISARPVGVYVMRDGSVDWRPTLDAQRIVVAVTTVVLVFLGLRHLSKRVEARVRVKMARAAG
ncbi:MAG: spore germination protein GerW family protein [Acidimicrobiia bacterium]